MSSLLPIICPSHIFLQHCQEYKSLNMATAEFKSETKLNEMYCGSIVLLQVLLWVWLIMVLANYWIWNSLFIQLTFFHLATLHHCTFTWLLLMTCPQASLLTSVSPGNKPFWMTWNQKLPAEWKEMILWWLIGQGHILRHACKNLIRKPSQWRDSNRMKWQMWHLSNSSWGSRL